jgi:hypothetical protein
MNEPFSIVPPPELRRQWLDNDHFPMVTGTHELLSITKDRLNSVMDQSAQWGADQELEACITWLDEMQLAGSGDIEVLRAARRPKPPSLKEQALLQLDTLNADLAMHGKGCDLSQIRRALEALDA